jgi:hypothetical protein
MLVRNAHDERLATVKNRRPFHLGDALVGSM